MIVYDWQVNYAHTLQVRYTWVSSVQMAALNG